MSKSKSENAKPDFSNLERMKVKPSATAIYTFHEIEGEPSLLVKPAHEINKPYMNAVLKKGKRIIRSLRRGKMNTATLEENREQDYMLFPKYVVENWPTPPSDVSGNPVPFSVENCEAFFRAIPIEMFTDLRDFCNDIDNYRDDDECDLDSGDREEMVKN